MSNSSQLPTLPSDVNAAIVQWGALPKFLIEGEVFYDTKDLFAKHNLGRDVARYCEAGDWHKSKKRFYLNARGIISLGFGKKTPQVLAYVFNLLHVSPKRLPEDEPARDVKPLPPGVFASPQLPAFLQQPFHQFSAPAAASAPSFGALPSLADWNAQTEFGIPDDALGAQDEFSSPAANEGTSSFEDADDGFFSSSIASSSAGPTRTHPAPAGPSPFLTPAYAPAQYYYQVPSGKRPIEALGVPQLPPAKASRLF